MAGNDGAVMSKRTDALVVAAMAASGGVIGEIAVGGGVAGTVAGGLVPVGVQAADRLGGLAVARRRERQGWVLEAADLLDPGVDVFEERWPDYDERVELLARVLEAAGRATFAAKIQALGRVLREGLSEDGDIGEATVLAAALAVVEPPHVPLLQYLDEHRNSPPPYEGASAGRPRSGWRIAELVEAQPWQSAFVMDALLAVLAGQGLVRDSPGDSLEDMTVEHWSITPMGRRCLLLLDGVR
jgi:hypothetical protein